jgi:hypothetical protein
LAQEENMKIHIAVETTPIKGGIEARVPALRLVGHGRKMGEATDCLQRGVLAWCRGLQATGQLQQTLASKGIAVEEGDAPDTISLVMAVAD